MAHRDLASVAHEETQAHYDDSIDPNKNHDAEVIIAMDKNGKNAQADNKNDERP
jgi:hypothetical protein